MDMFTLFQVLILIDGVLMWTLIGQGALVLLLGPKRSENFIYRFMQHITNPVWKVTRWITPRFIADRRIGVLAVILLILLRVILYMVFAYHGWIPPIEPQK